MSDTILKVENVSKLYRLGTSGTGSLKKDLHRWWTTKIRRNEDPLFTHSVLDNPTPKEQNQLWALKDVNFEVKRGEVLGIVGCNGSGKSTLLKILSRIVRPTSGTVRGRGKVNSLLEIGTGFNPELTGTENVFMSGYFLGMKKKEIQKKFDEIVDFSGVERFMDTPVKRYSSGMYMRLAFSVAAHLEPDILIVDEVLAVGDAEFQKKCLAKMQETSKVNGRTILFVSHDTQMVTDLCTKAIWLDQGRVQESGKTSLIVGNYLASIGMGETSDEWADPEPVPGTATFQINNIKISAQGKTPTNPMTVHDPIKIDVEFYCFLENIDLEIRLNLFTEDGICLFTFGSPMIKAEKKILAYCMVIPGNLLNNRRYTISLTVWKNQNHKIGDFKDCATFEIQDLSENPPYFENWGGVIRPKVDIAFYAKRPIEKVFLNQ